MDVSIIGENGFYLPIVSKVRAWDGTSKGQRIHLPVINLIYRIHFTLPSDGRQILKKTGGNNLNR